MNLSFSSLLISLLAVCLLVILLQFLLTSKKAYRLIRTDLLLILAFFVSMRLVFPVELANTVTVPSKTVLPKIYSFFETNLTLSGTSGSLFRFFAIIWIIGTIISYILFFFKWLRLKKLTSVIEESAQSQDIQQLIDSSLLKDTSKKTLVYQSSFVSTPFMLGIFHPRIFIPDKSYSAEERQNILLHEYQHIKNKDPLKKFLLQLIVSSYWWFLPLYLFRNQVHFIIELRVDHQVTSSMTKEGYFSYVESLVSVKKKEKKTDPKLANRLVTNFTFSDSNILSRRIEFLLAGFKNKRTKRYLLTLAFILPFIVTSFIFEPYRYKEADIQDTQKIESNQPATYILQKGNVFRLIIEGNDMGTISDLDDPSIEGIPIIKK